MATESKKNGNGRKGRNAVPAEEQTLMNQIENEKDPQRKKELSQKLGEMRFKRLAVPRVKKARKAIQLIANLASSQYHARPEHIDKILNTLGSDLAMLQEKFSKTKKQEDNFTL